MKIFFKARYKFAVSKTKEVRMLRAKPIFTLTALILMILVSSCGGSATPPADEVFKMFDTNNFSDSANIDNQWLPLTPGTQWVYEGETVEAGQTVTHRVVITVTDMTKEISGVRSLATWDLDFSGGELVEAELAFFAQDNDGNIWRMGEYPEEYEDGKFVEAPTWIHGLDDALAGIAMPADPQTGTPSYAEGWGPDVGWTDRGQVDQTGQSQCVPVDCYENVLVIKESSQAEPDAFQLKFYAPNVGNIYVDWTGADQTQELLELVELNQLSPEEMTEVRAKALEMEKHGREVSPDVYGQTSPLETNK